MAANEILDYKEMRCADSSLTQELGFEISVPGSCSERKARTPKSKPARSLAVICRVITSYGRKLRMTLKDLTARTYMTTGKHSSWVAGGKSNG
jgi:hypothetical protein